MTTLIDLDRIPAGDGPAPRRRPPRPARPVLAALCLVLVALLGGATILPSRRPPVIIPARLTDTTFLQGDELYVTGRAAGNLAQRLDVYRLPGARRIASFTVPVSSPIDETIRVGDVYLVDYQKDGEGADGLVALSATTGDVLWHSRYALFSFSARAGLALLDTGFYETSGRIVAVDVHTGAQRWSIPRGNSLSVDFADGAPRWLVSTDGAGRMTVYDGSTGAAVATSAGPEITSINTSGISENAHELIIATGDGRVTAYALPSLTPRWQSAVPMPASEGALDCGAVVCFGHQQQGTTAIDPVTGRLAWASDRWTYVDQAAGRLLVTSNGGDLDAVPIVALDPATGTVAGDLGGWHYVTTVDGNGLRYVQRRTGTRNEIYFGKVDWRRLTVSVAAVGEQISDSCQASAGIVVCRLVDASIAVYKLD